MNTCGTCKYSIPRKGYAEDGYHCKFYGGVVHEANDTCEKYESNTVNANWAHRYSNLRAQSGIGRRI